MQTSRVSQLRLRRCARSSQETDSDLELTLRSSSLTASFSTSETTCDMSDSRVESLPGGRDGCNSRASTARGDSVSGFEMCRPKRSGSNYSPTVNACGSDSRAASPSPLLGRSPCHSPTPTCATPLSPRSPLTPRSPRSPRSPLSPAPPSGRDNRRRSGATGNLARLASRRSSRDSEVGEPSPLQCSRMQQRRTSNFLEIPGIFLARHEVPMRVAECSTKPDNVISVRIRFSTEQRYFREQGEAAKRHDPHCTRESDG